MKIGAYIRVSTSSQNLSSQAASIEKWLVNNGYDLESISWYTDKESGTHTDRKGFKLLEEAIFQGEIDTVVVFKLDRLARTMRDGVNIISRWCEKGIRIVSITQQLDLSGAIGKMVAGLLFGVAEIELQYIKERQAIGIARAKEKGAYRGRRKHTMKANPSRAKELKSKGLKAYEIALSLGVSKRTVYNYLKE